MAAVFEGRESASPYIDRIWRGHNLENYRPICPAETRWNLLFLKRGRKVTVSVEGAASRPVMKREPAETEFLVVQFPLGVYLPQLPAGHLVNTDAQLPDASPRSFFLYGTSWELPTFDNVEILIERLVNQDILVSDHIVADVIKGYEPAVSERTVRRRFLHATGMTPTSIYQINRARRAALLLDRGTAVLDVVYEAGYADQSHMTRSLRRFLGQTPTQLIQAPQPIYCPICSRQGLFIDLCYTCSSISKKEFDFA